MLGLFLHPVSLSSSFHHFQSIPSLSHTPPPPPTISQLNQSYFQLGCSTAMPSEPFMDAPCKAAFQLLAVGLCVTASIALSLLCVCCQPVITGDSFAAQRWHTDLQSRANKCLQFKQAWSSTVTGPCRFNLSSSRITAA